MNLITTCLVLIAFAAGGLSYRGIGGSGSPPTAAPIAAVTIAATPILNGTPPSEPAGIGSRLDACTAEPRWAGYTDKLIAETQWEVSSNFPIGAGFTVLDGDFYMDGLPSPANEVIKEINAALVQHWACQIYDRRGDDNQLADPDDRYWSTYSDNFMRRQFRQRWLREGIEPRAQLDELYLQQAGPTEVVRAWDLSTPDWPRVAALLPRRATRVGTGDWAWLVIFAKEGDRWRIDEFSAATFDKMPEPSGVDSGSMETLDIIMFDASSMSTPDNGASISIRSDYSEHYTGGNVLLRVQNAGSLHHRLEISSPRTSIELTPNGSSIGVFHVPLGTKLVEFYVYEADNSEPMARGTLAFIDPGTEHPCCG